MQKLETTFIQGEKGRPALVFLHEGLGSLSMWKEFPAEVSRVTGCSALVYSRYGNGASPKLEGKREPRYMHEEALRALPGLLDEFGVLDAILIGHSDGASIALIYTGEMGERVLGVVAMAPHVFVEDLSVRSIAAAKSEYESGALREKLARYHQHVDETFYGWNDIWLDPRFLFWNIRESVRKIAVPLLLIQGVDDEYGTCDQLDAIRSDAQGVVDTLYLAKCGHSPHRDRPAIVAAAIAAFVATASGVLLK